MRELRRTVGLLTAGLIACGCLSGCAALVGSKSIDLGPFSENTAEMVGQVQKINRPTVWTHLGKYRSLPSVVQAERSSDQIRKLLRGVALYSVQVGSLHDSQLSEKQKVAELARYMEEIIRPALTSSASDFRVTTGYMDTLIADIRTRGKFLSALGAAQPLVSLTVATGDILFDRAAEDMSVATADINDQIETEFGSVKLRIAKLSEMETTSFQSYALIQRIRAGDATALDTLRLDDPGTREFMPPGHTPSPKQVDAAERFILDRLATIKTLREQLEPEFAVYKEHQAELEGLRNLSDERAQLGRATLYLWAHSHRNLAMGVPVPPMIDVVGIVKGTVETGIRAASPLPLP
jgi:hypothetical protein